MTAVLPTSGCPVLPPTRPPPLGTGVGGAKSPHPSSPKFKIGGDSKHAGGVKGAVPQPRQSPHAPDSQGESGVLGDLFRVSQWRCLPGPQEPSSPLSDKPIPLLGLSWDMKSKTFPIRKDVEPEVLRRAGKRARGHPGSRTGGDRGKRRPRKENPSVSCGPLRIPKTRMDAVWPHCHLAATSFTAA